MKYIIIILRQLLEQLFLTYKKSPSIGQHGKIRTWSLEELTFGLCLFFFLSIYLYLLGIKMKSKASLSQFYGPGPAFWSAQTEPSHICMYRPCSTCTCIWMLYDNCFIHLMYEDSVITGYKILEMFLIYFFW